MPAARRAEMLRSREGGHVGRRACEYGRSVVSPTISRGPMRVWSLVGAVQTDHTSMTDMTLHRPYTVRIGPRDMVVAVCTDHIDMVVMDET